MYTERNRAERKAIVHSLIVTCLKCGAFRNLIGNRPCGIARCYSALKQINEWVPWESWRLPLFIGIEDACTLVVNKNILIPLLHVRHVESSMMFHARVRAFICKTKTTKVSKRCTKIQFAFFSLEPGVCRCRYRVSSFSLARFTVIPYNGVCVCTYKRRKEWRRSTTPD